MWVNKYIDDCTDEDLNDRDFIASVVDRAIFHFAINSICNPGDNKDAMPIEQCTFDVETKNDLPSTVQLFYEESKDNEPLANIHFQAIGSGFLTFVNACQEHDDNSLKLFASLLISLSYSSAYADLSETVYINENNESYLKAQFEKLSQRDMKKYLGEMKRLADGGEMNFDGYLDKMSHLENEGTLDPDGYLTPRRIVFRTADGMREQKLGVAGSSGYGGNRGGREASITFDVFGHRTLSVLNIDNEK